MADGGRDGGEAPQPNPLALDHQLCFSVYSAANLMTRLYRPLLQPLGLTYLQYLAMLALWERSPQSVGELGQRLGLDSGTLTPLFKRMQDAGHLTRTRDPADERRVIIQLTESGRRLRDRALPVPTAVFCKLPGSLEELTTLKASIDRLVESLRDEPGTS
ncbi:MAG: MarR family transcriptional regulator [Phenylobacterium sp.]|nr:MarR family transcriptional regulator [Phenylobacterium sp.]